VGLPARVMFKASIHDVSHHAGPGTSADLFRTAEYRPIPLYSFNWLVFITETQCVYCAVRTGYLYIIQGSFSGL